MPRSTLLRLPRGFRTQSVLTYGALAVALAVSLAAAFGHLLSSQIQRDRGAAMQALADSVALTLSTGLADREFEVEALARSESLWREGLASRQVNDELMRVRTAVRHSAWIGVADRQGIVRAAADGVLLGSDVTERPWFHAGLAGTYVGDVHRAKLLETLLPRAADGAPLRFVDFAAPVVVNGQVAGVLAMHGSWEWVRSVVNAMVPRGATGYEVYLVDRKGATLYAPANKDPEAMRLPAAEYSASRAADAPAAAVVDDSGRRFLSASAPLRPQTVASDLGWTVVVRQPTRIAFAGVQTALRRAIAIGLVASVLAVLVAWIASGLLTRPLSEIARAALDVERGVPGASIPAYASNTELLRLSSALSAMTQRLVAGKLELEQRVQERTAELRRANAELARLAQHDPLTGLPNRRAFDQRLEIAMAAGRRSGAPVSVLVVDADHFKRINDSFGHAAGDAVLRQLGTLMASHLRETDCAARLGGEEFGILLPGTDPAGAMHVAQGLVERVAATEFPGIGRVTVSVGVATAAGRDRRGDDLVNSADAALYVAKAAGRNQARAAPG